MYIYIKVDTWTGGTICTNTYVNMYVIHICIHTYTPSNQSELFLHLHDALVSKDSGKKKNNKKPSH